MNTSLKPLEILLVEDSPEDVFFFQRALKRSGVGAYLEIAPHGKAAVEILARRKDSVRPDVVFLDLKMPFLNGFDVLRWIREEGFDPSLQVIVLSGSSHEKDQALAAQLGAVNYLVKPLSAEQLQQLLPQLTAP